MSSSISDDAPQPRLCHVRKWPDFSGYGFNLHAERGKTGHYVGSIDRCSPAEAAGILIDDRIVAVNGVNIGNENHRQVVERIKSVANETKLLVIDREGDAYYQERNIVITGDMDNILYRETPVVNPYSGGQDDEAEVSSMKSNSSDMQITATHSFGSQDDGLEFSGSVKEAREKMLKRRNVKSAGMTLKDKYDLLQKL